METHKNATSKMSLYKEREEGDFVHYQNQRAESPEPSCVSMKSDGSMRHPPDLSDGTANIDSVIRQKKSSVSSCVSMKSDGSMRHPPDLSDETFNTSIRPKESQTASCSVSSCVSMKSDGSMRHPPDLSDEAVTTDSVTKIFMKTQKNTNSEMSHYEKRGEGDFVHYQNQRAESPEPSCVSMKSDGSMRHPPDLSDGTATTDSVDDQSKNLQQISHQPVDDELQRVKDLHKTSMKNKLAGCCLSDQHCETVCSALQSSKSHLRELDMSNNDLLVKGVRLLCAGLKNSHCQLNILRLAGCRLSDRHCENLSSALQSSNSCLRELDLSNNVLQYSGVKLLCDGLESSHCQLNILRLAGCCLSDQHCESLSSTLQSSKSYLKEMDLSNNGLQDSGVKLLSDGLKNSHCQLNILRLAGCRLTGKGCESLSSVLQSSNSHLTELDLSNNDLQDSGVKLLSDGLKSSHSQLNVLRLVICNLMGQCCESLSSALQSSNSCLRELDLSNNDLKDFGVKLLSDGLKSSHCQLNILRLSGCMVTEEGCCYVSSALSSNPSHLRELDLSYNHPGESGIKLLSDTLNHQNYALDKLNVDHKGDFRITAGLHKYACDLTLDPNTANIHLILSDENRKVTYVEEKQLYPDHPERFDGWPQVLCRESLSGRCYWEAEWSGYAVMAVTYKGISRKGWNEFSEFGYNRNNRNSWSLICSETFTACHDNKETVIHVPSCSSKRIGVYVDWSAGTLSFYSVSDTRALTHLHTFTSAFTESLYAGFGVYRLNSSVSLCTQT